MVKRKELEANIPWWFHAIALIVLLFYLMSTELSLIGWLIIGVLIMFCASKCFKLASRVGANETIAYIIGFLFSFIGLLGYYAYYIFKRK